MDTPAQEDIPSQVRTVSTPMELRRTIIVRVGGPCQEQLVPIPMAQHVTRTFIALLEAPFLDRTAVHQVRMGQQNPVRAIIIARGEAPSQVPPVVPLVRTGHLNRVPVRTAALQAAPSQVHGAIQAILLVAAFLRMRQTKNLKHVRCL